MDKRTLEMAAKAAGYKFRVSKEFGQEEIEKTSAGGLKFYDDWKPLSRRSDTAMLAEAIGAIVDFELGQITVSKYEDDLLEVEYATDHNDSIQEALVALAARIGESMP